MRSLFLLPAFVASAALADPATQWAEGFATPESVLYDAATDSYLVSNINGAPLEKDNNGYITELKPNGKVLKAKFIAGGENGVTLNAPKGTALFNGVLYVADIDVVRLFDRKTGAPKGEVAIAGATFLNDVAAGNGKIYVTDSGLDAKFAGTGTDALYVITPGKTPKVDTFVKDTSLKGPNGLLVTKKVVHVVGFGGAELRTFDLKGMPVGSPTMLPKGGLDGIVAVGNDVLVSSWEGQAVFRGAPGKPFTEALTGLKSPADIAYDPKRKHVLVPRFDENRVEAYSVK